MREHKPLPPVLELKRRFIYCQESGIVTCRTAVSNRTKTGDKVGVRKAKHFTVKINGEHYQLHRVIWALVHESDPGEFVIDHADRDGFNNKLSNLRKATYTENAYNRARKQEKALPKGVRKGHKGNKYQAFITEGGKTKALGTFDTPEQAAAAYASAAKQITPDFYFSEKEDF